MFPGSPRSRGNIRVLSLATASQIALSGDDPDLIYIEALTQAMDKVLVSLPNTAPLGKKFQFLLAPDPYANPIISTNAVLISIPSFRSSSASVTVPLTCGQRLEFIYGPLGWLATSLGGLLPGGGLNNGDISIGHNANGSYGSIAIGANSNSYSSGVGVGHSTISWASGTALGNMANAMDRGVSIGYATSGYNTGTAIGAYATTANKSYAVALGYYSRATRFRELVKSADGSSNTKRSWSMVNWYGDTTTATAAEIFLGGTSSQYCLLQPNSALQFQMQIIGGLTGGGDTSSWTISGAIKQGATAAATALVGTPTVTMTGQDAGASTWAVAVSADTTNGSLKLVVTGAAASIRWNATATLSEMRY